MDLPKRKRIRLQGFDYSKNGAYFITICTHNRDLLFGRITNDIMSMNEYGIIVTSHIALLNSIYQDITVSKYVVMPNHVHILLTICRERIACVPNGYLTKSQLSKVIQMFKSSVTKEIHNYCKRNAYNAFPTVWQSHFHDHIIRNENEYQKIYNYIETNSVRWNKDCFYRN